MKTDNLSSRVRLPRMSLEESAEYRARQDAVIAAGVIQIRKDQEELIRLGIIDADGNLIKPFAPLPGQSGLHSEID